MSNSDMIVYSELAIMGILTIGFLIGAIQMTKESIRQLNNKDDAQQ